MLHRTVLVFHLNANTCMGSVVAIDWIIVNPIRYFVNPIRYSSIE